ncbi:hypothetical protein FA13DRAFT_1111912 [Coprinellus micaceus]|uniref:MYND-type domain-containing protein n=1 Tax=Coprinellus micaceus TaxID=71717 RepID=A0A4Y7SWP3_COPMI|nr:hypothetical protein FA13DRAFT_1111912 [Coprinellus micaceus]
MREAFTAHLTEKLSLLRGNEPGIQEIRMHAAEVERASRYLDKSTWVRICDNAKHLPQLPGDREDMPQKMCSRCHSVVYYSSECQREDWNALHRQECSHLAKSRRQQKRTGHWYSQNNRRFQATQLWHAYEDHLEVSNVDNRLASNAIVRIPVGRPPCRESMSTSLSKEYIENTRDVVPSYLQSRFKEMLSFFVKANAPRRAEGPRSAILVDRRLPLLKDSQINILILLRPSSVDGGARRRREGSKFLLQGILAYPSRTNQFPGVHERPNNGSANSQLLAEPSSRYV